MPHRIQRTRAPGYRIPDGAVYVGRPTKWANPFAADMYVSAEAVRLYELALLGKNPVIQLVVTVEDARRELAGRDLVCWCKLAEPCHADVLLDLANGEAQ